MKIAPPLKLDRMLIEEAGPNPQRLAAAIHAQLPKLSGPVPIQEIAYALDIVAIEQRPTKGFEAALIAPAERGEGIIVVSESSPLRRQRYSIGHELCHFLNPAHQPGVPESPFTCTASDLVQGSTTTAINRNQDARHRRQEAEANLFAIELLAPRHLVKPFLSDEPSLHDVLAMADALDVSREACARRYVDLHHEDVAMVFSQAGKVRYVQRSEYFPHIDRKPDQPLGAVPPALGNSGVSKRVVANPKDWLGRAAPGQLTIQTLHQQDGFAMTMLALSRVPGATWSAKGVRIRLPRAS